MLKLEDQVEGIWDHLENIHLGIHVSIEFPERIYLEEHQLSSNWHLSAKGSDGKTVQPTFTSSLSNYS